MKQQSVEKMKALCFDVREECGDRRREVGQDNNKVRETRGR